MKSVDIFYFDIDGTILNNFDQTISDLTIKSLNLLKASGYKVAMATGRAIGAIVNTEFENMIEWDGYVLANGGVVLDKNKEVLRNVLCETNFIVELIKLYPKTIILEGDEVYLVNEPSPLIIEFLGASKVKIPEIIEYNNEEINKIIIEDISLIADGFNNPIFENYDYHLNTENMYEIFPKNSGKDFAINFLNDHLNVKDYAYFGDGHNDVLAIKEAKFGIAMGNAVSEAKVAADYVTEHVGEDGIYKALKNFNLI